MPHNKCMYTHGHFACKTNVYNRWRIIHKYLAQESQQQISKGNSNNYHTVARTKTNKQKRQSFDAINKGRKVMKGLKH